MRNALPISDDRRFEEAVDWRDRTIVLRSLRREDRPHHQVFLAQVNPQDMYLRFFGGVRELPPEALDRLLQPDPERELALAVVGEGANRVPEILAVGRACAEPDDVNAEVALLVRSDLKGFGLGALLLERVIAWCSRRVTRRLFADVLLENTRMLRLARRHGFRVESVQDGVVRAMLELRGHRA